MASQECPSSALKNKQIMVQYYTWTWPKSAQVVGPKL